MNLPDKIEEIGDAAFSYDSIKEISIPENSKFISKDEQGIIYNYRKTRLIWAPQLEKINILLTVQYISDHVFVNNIFTKIIIPPDCRSIGGKSFLNCVNLETVIITGNIDYIGPESFLNAGALKTIYYFGTTKLDSPKHENNLIIYVCQQYRSNTAMGITPKRSSDNCPLYNMRIVSTPITINFRHFTYLTLIIIQYQ